MIKIKKQKKFEVLTFFLLFFWVQMAKFCHLFNKNITENRTRLKKCHFLVKKSFKKNVVKKMKLEQNFCGFFYLIKIFLLKKEVSSLKKTKLKAF